MILQFTLVLSLLLLTVIVGAGSSTFPLIIAITLLLSANINYLKSWNHVLLMLLTLEVLILANTLIVALFSSTSRIAPETLFILFTLAVCEASIGVAVLVCYSRSFGNDLLQTTRVV